MSDNSTTPSITVDLTSESFKPITKTYQELSPQSGKATSTAQRFMQERVEDIYRFIKEIRQEVRADSNAEGNKKTKKHEKSDNTNVITISGSRGSVKSSILYSLQRSIEFKEGPQNITEQ
jgi:hypothetical protein